MTPSWKGSKEPQNVEVDSKCKRWRHTRNEYKKTKDGNSYRDDKKDEDIWQNGINEVKAIGVWGVINCSPPFMPRPLMANEFLMRHRKILSKVLTIENWNWD